jgi:hypothetical protein
MKKLFLTILFTLVLSGNAYAKMFVLNKCWEPIEKNAYGDKVKNFKEYKQVQNEKFKNTIYVFEDYIIKINSEKMTIVTKDLFKEESWPFSTMEFEIINFKNNMLVGKGKPPFSKQIININLNNKKAAIWNSKQDKKDIKFDISCKLYEGSDDSTLRSILKMINN